MNEYAAHVNTFGVLVGYVEFKYFEISLYRYNGKQIEIWFNPHKNKITDIKIIKNPKFNPYLKFVNPLHSN